LDKTITGAKEKNCTVILQSENGQIKLTHFEKNVANIKVGGEKIGHFCSKVFFDK
jgi:hypothetical protein